MPEFILDTGSPAAAATFASLPEFVQGYIEALFFTDTGTGDDSDLEHVTFADLAPETLERIQRDCDAFADRLTAESETFGQVDLYLGDDSRLYLA
jgi:hypothetical protein